MLHIKCEKCGKTLKGKEVTATPFYAYINGVKYQDYAVACIHCGGLVAHERFIAKAAENKKKAMAKLQRKTGKSIKQITEAQQYSTIMRKVYNRAKEIAASNPFVRLKDIDEAVNELPQDERNIVLAYEDKQDMALLKSGYSKPTKHIDQKSILLLTQAIIESAIVDKDEDFFKTEYGEQIVDTYNTTLSMHTHHDYEITAALLLEKMRKGGIK